MNFVASAEGMFDLGSRKVPCALGLGGVRPAADKREGDGVSPAGVWPIRRLLYRPDRGARWRSCFRAKAHSIRTCCMTWR